MPPLKGEELLPLQKQVERWTVVEEHHITKAFKFPDFRKALDFVDRVGALAEEQGIIPISSWPGEKLRSRSGHTRSVA